MDPNDELANLIVPNNGNGIFAQQQIPDNLTQPQVNPNKTRRTQEEDLSPNKRRPPSGGSKKRKSKKRRTHKRRK